MWYTPEYQKIMSMVSNKTPSVPRHIFIPEDLPKISKMFDQLLNMYTNPKLYIDACVYHRDLFRHLIEHCTSFNLKILEVYMY